ncbi:glycosyl hydrolase [Flavobacterium sp. TMP13]|uniref:glycosyl hydrolase n=1 Tax=Flavobacterium sp. TMP13 TaxID=3425950 RepID=UPI003D76D713
MFIKKTTVLFFVFAMLIFQGCKTAELSSSKAKVNESQTLAHYLKNLQYSEDGKHLFGHESTIMMGVGGDKDWELKNSTEIGNTIADQKSDVKEITGQLPAIMGYDAFKLILDVTDGPNRMEEVKGSVKALKIYRDNGGLLAFNWHMQPVLLPSYKERAYRMDEFNNNPHIELMKKEQPFYHIANGFESKDKWWTAYETQRLKPMAERLKCISADGSGIIFRPFHEADGDWFWWGLKYLQGDQPLNGKEALMKVFVETARYLKQELPGILIAFSTDKLDHVSHENAKNENEIADRYKDEFNTYLPKNRTDLALIDMYGMDLYTSKDNPLESLDRCRIKLQGLSLLAKEHDKIAAITEAGNRGLPSEEDERQPTINYYNDYLSSWISDKNVHVALVVIWQNWSNNRDRKALDPDDGYFIPIYKTSAAGKDFINYVDKKQTIMLPNFKAAFNQYKKP